MSTAAGEFRVKFLEENMLSKWHEQGALRNKSTGLKIRSKLDRKRYE
jgi:hypothetical protein